MAKIEDTLDKLVRVEKNRGRVSLGRVVPGLRHGDMFRVETHGDQIILTRVKAVPLNSLSGGGRDHP